MSVAPHLDIRDLLAPGRESGGQRPALIHRDRQFSHAELDRQADALASTLTQNMAPGELLALWLPNGPELICLILASLKCGVVPMPLHAGMKWPEVRAALRQARARRLIGSPALLAAMSDSPAESGLDTVHASGEGDCRWPAFAAATAADEFRPPDTQPDDPALVLLTSGSAGQPKCVVLSAAALADIVALRLALTRLDADCVSVVASCLTQSVGLHQSLALLAAGGCAVLLDGYDIPAMVEAIDAHRPTHLIMVVDAFSRLLADPALPVERLRALRCAAVGADRVTASLQERFIALTGKPLHVSYGMTESSWALVNFSANPAKCLALGRPPGGAEVRLVADTGREITEAGEVGEIQLRSPRTMLGYLNDPAQTEAAFADGWLRSGDLAYRDADGDYWFAGRCKPLIVLSSGDNVSPVEVEQACLGCPGVSQCLVVAAHDQAADCLQVQAYVTRDDPTLDESALRAFLAERLSAFKIPQRIFIVDALPLGLTGKAQAVVPGKAA